MDNEFSIKIDLEKRSVTYYTNNKLEVRITYNQEDFNKLVKPLVDDLQKMARYFGEIKNA